MQLAEIAGVALACVLASASKYALAWRGRHIFNPAAAGAFLAGLTGLNIATWWAATPAMLWLVLPGVLLVLYRIRKLPMAAVFTVVAVSIVAADLLRTGMELSEALWQPLAQRPVLFFVGFMLTEPLTLPPRRWQQLALAAVVGVLFAVPYNLGFVANSPELALLVGNALAFAAGQRGGVRLRVRRHPSADADDDGIQLPPGAPGTLHPGTVHGAAPAAGKAAAGGNGKGDGGIRRVFSLTSAPGAALLTIGVGTAEPVSIGQTVAAGPGTRRRAHGHHGGRRLRPAAEPGHARAAHRGRNRHHPLHGPTGRGASGPAGDRDVVLLYLAKNAANWPTPRSCSAPGARPGPACRRFGAAGVHAGRRCRRIDAAALKELVPDVAGREVFVSGSPASVRSLRAAARGAGARRVHVDSFTGY